MATQRPSPSEAKRTTGREPSEILELLARDDKWYLGGAPGLLHAPPAPIWSHHPGFWDPAHYLHFPVRAFTFGLIEDGRIVDLKPTERSWRPDRVIQHYAGARLEVTETRVCGPTDTLSSVVEIHNGDRARTLQLVMWTMHPVTDDAPWSAGSGCADSASPAGAGDRVLLRNRCEGLRDTHMDLSIALAMEGARSHSVDLSQAVADRPWFELTPYSETLAASGLPNCVSLTGVDRNGVVFAALERRLVLGADERMCIRLACGVSVDTDAALALASDAVQGDPSASSEAAWTDWFASVPAFTCSDPWLETYYWYRWYGLRLNRIAPGLGNYSHPAVVEGIDYFRVPISYSAQCHMLETRWMHDPELARGSLLNFVDHQRADGSIPNHIHADFVAPEGIYHADWGARTLDVHDVHPDEAFLRNAYPALVRYAEYFYENRDAGETGLYDLVNQWESGQEYMSRYVWVDDAGDEWRPMTRRLKGLDATLYIYRLESALARISEILGLGEEERWLSRARVTRDAILEHCWDPAAQAFMDLSPELERSGLVFATSFYPFFTDLVGDEHLPSIDRYLLSEDHFWTPFPVPASPRSDPHYSATPVWKGKRTNCPWNGRTWPMTNSHVAEALACASNLRADLRSVTAAFIHSFVRMMFHDGDPSRPNAFEHYNPDTGHPSAYRGIDDYQHSWVVDLIIKYVAGVRPVSDGVRIDPFPFGLDAFSLADVRVRGRRIDVDYDATGFRVRLDGELAHSSEAIEVVELEIPQP